MYARCSASKLDHLVRLNKMLRFGAKELFFGTLGLKFLKTRNKKVLVSVGLQQIYGRWVINS